MLHGTSLRCPARDMLPCSTLVSDRTPPARLLFAIDAYSISVGRRDPVWRSRSPSNPGVFGAPGSLTRRPSRLYPGLFNPPPARRVHQHLPFSLRPFFASHLIFFYPRFMSQADRHLRFWFPSLVLPPHIHTSTAEHSCPSLPRLALGVPMFSHRLRPLHILSYSYT